MTVDTGNNATDAVKDGEVKRIERKATRPALKPHTIVNATMSTDMKARINKLKNTLDAHFGSLPNGPHAIIQDVSKAVAAISAGILRIEAQVRKLKTTAPMANTPVHPTEVLKAAEERIRILEATIDSLKLVGSDVDLSDKDEVPLELQFGEAMKSFAEGMKQPKRTLADLPPVLVGSFKSEEHGPVQIMRSLYAEGGVRVTVETPEEGVLEELSLCLPGRHTDDGSWLAVPKPTDLAQEAYATGLLPILGGTSRLVATPEGFTIWRYCSADCVAKG